MSSTSPIGPPAARWLWIPLLLASGLAASSSSAAVQPGAGGPSASGRPARYGRVLEPETANDDAPIPESLRSLIRRGFRPDQNPVQTPNVRANDPTGDLTTEGQTNVSLSPWGHFVVAAWNDTRGRDAPAGTPPHTYGGYGYSCDFGTTWTDAGDLPRSAANEQLYMPWVTNDGRGNFYLVAFGDSGLDASGVPSGSSIALWKGSLDTLACTLSWQPRRLLVNVLASTNEARSSKGAWLTKRWVDEKMG